MLDRRPPSSTPQDGAIWTSAIFVWYFAVLDGFQPSNRKFGFLRSPGDEKQGSVPRSKERVMRALIGRVHGHRRHAGGQRKAATTWRSTVGGLVILALLLVPLASAAQLPRTIPRIAYLSLAPGPLASRSEAFVQGLRELGHVEGQDIIMEYRWSAGNVDRLREHAAELVRLGVHVIVTGGPLATRAAKDLTRTLPIVMAGDIDPVGDGFVASLGRPGGNITGVTTLSRELSGKRLELLKDTVPGLARVAVLWNPAEVSAARQLRDTEDAARVLGLQVQAL
jgi:ABC-type uncharacterized transport system substrate-binding protein